MIGGAVAGVLLAGGQSRRMGGGDKCLQTLGGRTLLEMAVTRAGAQVDRLVLNANGDPGRFAGVALPPDLPIIPDVIEGFAGPLAGILTGMEWAAREMRDAEFLVSFAIDAPFFPLDMTARLLDAVTEGGADMACAITNGRTHPVFAVWPVRLRGDLRHAMEAEDMRKIDKWTARYNIIHVDFPAEPLDPFFNVNTPEDLAEAERLLAD